MKIIIVGCGNVGATIAEKLSKEGHDITIIDNRHNLLEEVADAYDVLGVEGNGTSFNVQMEAGIDEADLLIAVTGMDEINLLCCLIARKAGKCHTIARVSNPVYSNEISFIKEELGLSMVINPQDAAASEMERHLKFPSALEVDTFAKSRVELVNYVLDSENNLNGMAIKDISKELNSEVLIPIVERGEEVIIPNGEFMFKEGDKVSVVGSQADTFNFFKKIGAPMTTIKDVLIVGGSHTAVYLAKQLLDMGMRVKIIDKNKKRCVEINDMLPKALVICGDATDKDLLVEEELEHMDAFVACTNMDEENIMLSIYAKEVSKAKTIAKVHRTSYTDILDSLDIGSIIYPRSITAERIIKYVRAMENSIDSGIETLYLLRDGRIEALEFRIKEDDPVVGISLMDLNLKDNIIVACITHNGKVIIPNGKSVMNPGDTAVILTTKDKLNDISDILE